MKNAWLSRLSHHLKTNVLVQISEIITVFLIAGLVIFLLLPWAGDHLLRLQGVIWLGNVVMLLLVWMGLRLRGESWLTFGLSFKLPARREMVRTFLLSLLVFVLAMAGFMFGSIIMINITGMPEQADMSSYAYMKDNLPMLVLTLVGVYIVSSFGEEVIYRAFLINRIKNMFTSEKAGEVVAVIISAIIFGLVHYSWGPMGIVQTGFMGLALAWCYLRFKNLWILVIAHGYMDTILMVQMYLASN